MPPRSRTWAKERSTISPRRRMVSRPVGVNGSPGRLVAMPTQIALGRFGVGDACLPHAILERLQLLARMIALVGDRDAGGFLARRQPDRVEVARGGLQCRRKRRR